jgi:UDP-3-O-[3-hydroxymyristoyl] glucosamine N-acyltransferase
MKFSVKDILNHINTFECVGNTETFITDIKSINDTTLSPSSLFWCSDANISLLEHIRSGVGLISKIAFNSISHSLTESNSQVVLIVVEKPRVAFMQLLKHFYTDAAKEFGIIHSTAQIDSSVIINKNLVRIGANVVIEGGVTIGDYTSIDHNTVIKKDTKIGSHVTIGCNNTIGGAGFGYEPNENGEYEFIIHIGNVVIEDQVEIGNNTTIDRAVLGSTVIGKNVKIDNLVHVAHGVQIGQNSLIIANSMIAGSVIIGENVWISPSSSIKQKLTVGNNSLIGMGAAVIKNVDESSVVAGVPAKKINDK